MLNKDEKIQKSWVLIKKDLQKELERMKKENDNIYSDCFIKKMKRIIKKIEGENNE